ncbi:MAG: InlB B-repeat-containing protein [Butyrivibrio sp.]|nr:InlB B-repeat-containing protein [Butyrivibrio sp.]
MRKGIARKISLLLALVFLTTTFGSDYNSIGVRASESEEITDGVVDAETVDADASENNEEDSYWEPQEDPEEEAPAEEEPKEEDETPADETPADETPAEEAPAVETPADETPAEDAPAEGEEVTSPEETPADETPADETPTDEETPAEDAAAEGDGAPADETPTEEVPVDETATDEAPAEGIVITYVAGVGGTVSVETETATDVAVGSTAIPNEGFEFERWAAEDGGTICPVATFIPEGPQIHENATYTALFTAIPVEEEEPVEEEKPNMPAQSFDGSDGSITVHVDADEGAFPEDTKMFVTEVKNQDILDKAANAIGGDTATVSAVDITFKADGKEVEPEIPIRVKLYSKEIEEADATSVVHIEDSGDANVVSNTAVSGDEVAFNADSFSVYVVVTENDDNCRITVNFFKDESTPIATMYVKKGDDLEQVLYDPNFVKADDENFIGWTKDKDYGPEETGVSIVDIRSEVEGMLPPEKDLETELNFYAILLKQYTVTYFDIDGASLGQDSIVFRADTPEGELDKKYTVNKSYIPTDTYHNFEGWNVTEETASHVKAVGDAAYDGTPILNETEITIDGDVALKVNAPEGRWLIFNENGKGANYTAPQFVKTGENTSEPNRDNMERNGYTFDDWYLPEVYEEGDTLPEGVNVGDPKKDDNGYVKLGTKFVFNQPLTENTTIYAGWTPVGSAKYTYVIWKEKLEEGQYELKASKIYSDGEVGTNIPYNFVDNGAEDYVTVGSDDFEFHYTGFFYNPEKTKDVKITPEGDAVINLYFDRITYKLKFYMYRQQDGSDEYICANNSGNGSEPWANNGLVTTYTTGTAPQYKDKEGNVQALQYDEDGDYKNYYFSITARYGAYIGDQWPTYDNIVGTGEGRDPVSFVMMVGTTLKPVATNQGSGTVKGIINTLDDSILGATNDADGNYLIVRFNTYYTWNYHIWYEYVEGMDIGDAQTHEYRIGDHTYTFYNDHDITARSSNEQVTSQNPPKYAGFVDTDQVIKLGENWNNSNYWPANAGRNGVHNINFVYLREAYKVTFKDGVYVNDKGTVLDTRPNVVLDESGSIEQGASLPKNVVEYEPENTPTGYVFAGWYADEGCQQVYELSGTTMPVGGIVVYAKWQQIQYRVFLHPNAYIGEGEDKVKDSSLNWGSDDQEMTFRVSYGGKVSSPTGTRDDYTFVGWFKDPEFKQPFNAEAFVLNEENVTAEYLKTEPTEYVDKWGEPAVNSYNKDADQKRFWINKKLDLYGEWREKVPGANGIGVEYDLTDPDVDGEKVVGTGTAADSSKYVDKAFATAVPAVKAEGYVFSNWVMQKWNEQTKEYEDVESSVILPGQKYTVLKANAHMYDVEYNEKQEIVSATYTIHLRAEFKKAEAETLTFIPWYANTGAEAFHVDTIEQGGSVDNSTLKINQSVSIQNPPENGPAGCDFLGWAKVSMGTTLDAAKTFMTTEGNWKKTLTESNLFIYYSDGKFYRDAELQNEATEVAADEDEPYEAMFAVWTEPVVFDIEYKVETLSEDASAVGGTVDPEKEEGINAKGDLEEIKGSTATETPGYEFVAWYKGDEIVTFNYTISQSDVINYLNRDEETELPTKTEFTAVFKARTYEVGYAADENGKITSADGTKKASFVEGPFYVTGITGPDGITLQGAIAIPDKGYKLKGWYKLARQERERPQSMREASMFDPDQYEFVTDKLNLTPEIIEANLNKDISGLYQDTAFLAVFEPSGDTYNVYYAYEVGGKTNPELNKDISIFETEGVTGSTATPDAGYDFDGWYNEKGEKISDSLELTSAVAIENLNSSENKHSATELVSDHLEEVEGEPYITYETTTYTAKFIAREFNVVFEYRIADGVEKPANWDALQAELSTHNTKAKVGADIICPDLPTVEGYTFSLWSMEEIATATPVTPVGLLRSAVSSIFGMFNTSFVSHAASQILKMPASDVVVYSVVTKNTPQIDPDDDPDDEPDRRTIHDDPTPTSGTPSENSEVQGASRPAEQEAVLGVKREEEEAAVLGARRGGTEDTTNPARVLVLLFAAGAAITMLLLGKRREEKE